MSFREMDHGEKEGIWQSALKRLTRGVGWITFIAGFGAVVVYGLVAFAREPGLGAVLKVFILTGLVGLVALFVSVLWDRVTASRTDRYKEVEK